MGFSVKELWELQEKLWDDPRLPEILEVVKTFPKPRAVVLTPAEQLVNILFGFHMEEEAVHALRERGYDVQYIDEEHHLELSPMPRIFTQKNDIICNGVEYDIKAWHNQKSFANPQWVSYKPTMDLILRNYEMVSLYFTGKRNTFNANKIANEALHFEFTPQDSRIFDYQNRMRAVLAFRGLF